ncbi:MAG TPA: hypothetical protein VF607_07725 [Verrucomicrobiae bacterium]
MSAYTEPKFAWEPVTPHGVAAFARASLERLVVVQSIFALLAAAVVVWLLSAGFFPTVKQAIATLPDQGEITRGQLVFPESATPPAKLLAEGHFLAISLDPDNSHRLRSPAFFQLEFNHDSLVVISLLGELELPYPADQAFYFNRKDLLPAWDAWAPDILGLTAIGLFIGLFVTWWLLASLYFLPVWLVAYFTDRQLNFREAWKLAAAALLPGAMLLTLGLALFGVGGFDLVQLAFAFTMHLIIGWIYLLVSPMFLDRVVPAEKKNPFAAG